MALPKQPQSRAGMPPRRARVMLGASAKVGKTTLLGNWAPQTTLIVDTHQGTLLLEGEHYVVHVRDWPSFVGVIDDIVRGGHPFHTIGLDLVNDLWAFCDLHHGHNKDGMKVPASGMDDYGRSNTKARSAFNAQIGRLLAAPVGIWFITHLREKTNKTGELVAYAPDVDKAIYSKINGAVDFVWLADVQSNGQRVVYTAPTAHFEAGSRVPMPSPLALDAREIAVAMDRALNPQDYDESGERKKPAPEVPEAVAPTAEAAPEPDTPAVVRDLERTGESDLLNAADQAWYDAIKVRIDALGLKGPDVKGALKDIGAAVPERVSSWSRTLCRLSDGQRASLNVWLLEREQAGTPFEAEPVAEGTA